MTMYINIFNVCTYTVYVYMIISINISVIPVIRFQIYAQWTMVLNLNKPTTNKTINNTLRRDCPVSVSIAYMRLQSTPKNFRMYIFY